MAFMQDMDLGQKKKKGSARSLFYNVYSVASLAHYITQLEGREHDFTGLLQLPTYCILLLVNK